MNDDTARVSDVNAQFEITGPAAEVFAAAARLHDAGWRATTNMYRPLPSERRRLYWEGKGSLLSYTVRQRRGKISIQTLEWEGNPLYVSWSNSLLAGRPELYDVWVLIALCHMSGSAHK